MLSMQPICEPDVIQLLNDGRFEGAIEGYVVMEGPQYRGHALFCMREDEVVVLDTGIEDRDILDGVVRACLAAGENRGAKHFTVNVEHPPLARWWETHTLRMDAPMEISALWGGCTSR